jgi:Spy/CpxP family protein refolding chaperone
VEAVEGLPERIAEVDMKGLNKRLLVGAMALTVPLGLIAADLTMAADEETQGALAGNATQVAQALDETQLAEAKELAQSKEPLIDSEFENAVRVIVTKRFCNRIDASDEQRAKLTALFKDTMQSTRPTREQFRRKLLDVSALMASETATDDQIKQEVQAARAIKQQLMDQRIDTALAVRKILTPEQRKKIHERISNIIAGNIKPKRLSWIMQKVSMGDNQW